MARVLSLQTGRPLTLEGDDPWVTSICKQPVTGPVQLDWLDLEGNEQADLTVHGVDPHKAVCVYSDAWRASLRE